MSDKKTSKDTGDEVVEFPLPEDNIIQTFQLEVSSIRGRVLRLGSVLNDILDPHDYPDPIARLTGQTACLTLILSSILKYDGIFTLQIQGDGPIAMLVSDVDQDGKVRACAHFNQEKYEAIEDPGEASLKDFFGKGYLAFTVDQGPDTETYQGIVGLEGETLEECVAHYFSQSEQLETVIKLSLERKNKEWRAGAIMVQRMPIDPVTAQNEMVKHVDEDWNRTNILLQTVTDKELLDQRLHENTLLMRLFHEEGVRVYSPVEVQKGCRCSTDKLLSVLASLPKDDLDHITVEGKVEITCEFCSQTFKLDPPEQE